MEVNIESEIREGKIKRISDAEEKLDRFKRTYEEIKQSSISHISHNISSTIIRVVILIISMLFAATGISFMMPVDVIGFLNRFTSIHATLSPTVIYGFFYAKFILWGLALLLAWIFSLLRGNYRKRNTIHSFSKLLQEMIDHTQEYTREEKRKYEIFIDSSGEGGKDNTDESEGSQGEDQKEQNINDDGQGGSS